MKSTIIWDVMPCHAMDMYQYLNGAPIFTVHAYKNKPYRETVTYDREEKDIGLRANQWQHCKLNGIVSLWQGPRSIIRGSYGNRVIVLGDKKMGKGKMYREHKEAVYNT